MKKLFVYGTLLNGKSNWQWALNRPDVNFLGEQQITGKYTMVSLGAFPGVIPTGESTIHGEVYEVPDDVYRSIERLEGYNVDTNYRFYDKMEVETVYGKAEMYILDESYLQYKVIESGSWRLK